MARWICGEYDWNKIKAFRVFCGMEEQEKEEVAKKLEYVDYFDPYENGYNKIFNSFKGDVLKLKGYDGYNKKRKKRCTEYGKEYYIWQPCTNKKCFYYDKDECRYFGNNELLHDCFSDIMYSLVLCIELGGDNAIKELKEQVNKDVLKWASDNYNTKKGIIEEQVYGGDKMSKPFWVALSEIKGESYELSVFWTDNMMYINGKDDSQANTNTSLFQAYRFASLIGTSQFDYEATDEEVKDFQKELLDFYRNIFSDEEQEQYIVDVWDYLDDIATDYHKLTGVQINDIGFKRAIVAHMSETDLENEVGMGFGSATYIARLVHDYIIGDERTGRKGCDNSVAIKLAKQYLQTDDYDLHSFAKALHNTQRQVTLIINGSLWVNSAKYEYVDKIVIEKDDVSIYRDNKIIGSVARENIKTIEEEYYDNGGINNVEDVLNFDIKKVGDF